jgi:hypothetical protein
VVESLRNIQAWFWEEMGTAVVRFVLQCVKESDRLSHLPRIIFSRMYQSLPIKIQ